MTAVRPVKPNLEPLHEFKIPSLHDSLQLDCRIYAAAPRDPEAAGGLGSGHEGHLRGAIIAHPYAPLGGSQDDHIVLGVAETLVGSGWTVATFNFRGVKGQGRRGSTSWTSKPEVHDYQSVTGCLVSYLSSLARGRGDAEAQLDLILGGYSYGAMVVSQTGDALEFLAAFSSPAVDSPATEINDIAASLAERALKGTEAAPAQGRIKSEKGITSSVQHVLPRPQIRPNYLLISPPLPPISTMLQLSMPSVPRAVTKLFRGSDGPDEDKTSMESAQFLHHPTLAIFGAAEEFTSPKKLSAWAERMAAASPVRTDYVPRQDSVGRSGSIVAIPAVPHPAPTVVPRMFEWDQVEDAGHFWREPSTDGILRGRVRDWAATL